MMVVKCKVAEPWMTYEGPAKRPRARHEHTAASKAHMRSHKAAPDMRRGKAAKAAPKVGCAEATKAPVHSAKAAAEASVHSSKASAKAAEATSGRRRRC